MPLLLEARRLVFRCLFLIVLGGRALAGCTSCNWGTLSGTISGGNWSGTLAGVPGGGPYFISVRAANGTGYVTMT